MSDTQDPQASRKEGWHRWIVGPALALLCWNLPLSVFPAEMTANAQWMAGWMMWIVAWWVFEPIPVAASALVGACGIVVLDILSVKDSFYSFGHPLVFLFLGGFILARSMAVHGLDRRVALFILAHPIIAGRSWRIIVALLCVSAFLSMWISNTATTAMLLPITLGITNTILPNQFRSHAAILIAVAYASSIGGIATPVGSPPNIIAQSMLDELGTFQIDFLQWMSFGVPTAAVLLLLLIWVTRFQIPDLPKQTDTAFLRRQYLELGPLKRGEINTMIAIGITVTLWIVPGLLAVIYGPKHPYSLWFDDRFPETVAAILGASLLFLLPQSRNQATLSWKESMQIDWASLILFGGGLALGKGMFDSGLAKVLGAGMVEAFGGHFWLFVFAAVVFSIFFTELVSNTATASMLVPLIVASAQQSHFSPFVPTIAVTLACSLAFMMPVSTPPNAIVYGSGRIELSHMMKKGLVMNLLSIVVLMLMLWALRQFE